MGKPKPFLWKGHTLTSAGLRCTRCGSGFPCCADINPRTNERFRHEDVCGDHSDIFPAYDELELCSLCNEQMEGR